MSGREDAGQRAFVVRRIDDDASRLHVDAPVGDRPEIRDEAVQHEQMLGFDARRAADL